MCAIIYLPIYFSDGLAGRANSLFEQPFTSVRHDLGPLALRSRSLRSIEDVIQNWITSNSLCPSGRGASTEWSAKPKRRGQGPLWPPRPIGHRGLRPEGLRALRLSPRKPTAFWAKGAFCGAPYGSTAECDRRQSPEGALPPAPKGASHLLVLRSIAQRALNGPLRNATSHRCAAKQHTCARRSTGAAKQHLCD